MTTITDFKSSLAKIFDDNLHTKQWHNYVDYFIIGTIMLSTISVFISTLDPSPELARILKIIDIFTLIIFTVEVTLRIWVADIVDERYKGIRGRIKYCCSFYGLIDILSTYPYYIHLFLPVPYNLLKALRIARLLRILRYMHSFSIMKNAITSKKHEMIISLQFLFIITLFLSFILFYAEHSVQPEVYDNGFVSVIWAFAQYIGDPGDFADTPPITFVGRLVACIVGILGIAIFAVPAGLLGAGFTEALEQEEHDNIVNKNIKKIKATYESKLDRPTGLQIIPQYLSLCDIQARIGLSQDDIFDAIISCDNFRLINLAVTQPVDEHPTDRLAVEFFPLNRPYGYCINRNSKVTIVSPSSVADPAIGHFSFYLAKIGGFNYISRDLGELRPYHSFYSFPNRDSAPYLEEYMRDLEELTSTNDSWTLTLLVASGANEPSYPTQFHFSAGGSKGDESFEGENLVVSDIKKYKAFFDSLTANLEEEFGYLSDHQRYHNLSSPKLFARHYREGCGSKNNIVLRIAWSVCLWDMKKISVAKTIARHLNNHFENGAIKPDVGMKKKYYEYSDIS